ncbi:hypothetical protein PMZ80_010577 [Knufia obscura]|uniref:Uncharacterized protein n=1 Tax=Knufia obscura TaxID=1635080 RepID=A0ABR0R9H0_9EURO|nr:hypothetical protein PMZ80_010577 [Knufia obscura]
MAGIKQTELQKDVEQKALHMTDLKDMLDNSKKAQRRLQAERSRELDELRNMSLLNLEQKQMSITELRRRLQVAEEQTQSLVEEVTRVNKESATTRLEWANDVERLEAIHHEQIQEKVTLADRLQQELTQAVQLQQSLTDANKEQRRRLDCAITEQTQERQRLQEKLHQADCELEKQQSLREAHEHTGAGKGVQPGISRSGMQHRPFERNSPIPLIEFRVHERPVQGLCLRLKSFVTEARPLDIQAAREPHKIQGLMTDMLDRQKVKDMSFGMHKSIAEIERLTVGMCRDVLEELEYDDEGSFLQIGSLRLVQRTRVSYYGLGAGQTIWLMLLPKAVGRSTVSGYEEEGLTYTDPDTRDLSLLSFDDMRFTNQLRSVEDDGEDSERTVEEYRHEEEDETEYEDEPEKIVRNRTSSFRTQPVVEVVVVQVKPPSRFIYLRPKSYVPCSQELAQCGYDPSTKVPEFMTKMVRHHLEHGKFFAQSDRVKELESNIRFVTSPMPEIPFQSEGGSFLQLGYRRLKPSDKISSLWLKDGDSIWLMQRPLRTGRSGKLMKDKYMTFEDPAKQQHVLLPFHDPKLVKHPGAEQNRQKLIYVRQAFTPSDPI